MYTFLGRVKMVERVQRLKKSIVSLRELGIRANNRKKKKKKKKEKHSEREIQMKGQEEYQKASLEESAR